MVNIKLGARRFNIAAENILLIFTVLAVFIGVILGLILWDPNVEWNKRDLSYLSFPGDMFVRMLKMLILPLIMSSIMVWDCPLVMIIQPGYWTDPPKIMAMVGHNAPEKCISNALDTVLDLIRNMFPDNLVEAAFAGTKSCIKFYNKTAENITVHVPTKQVLLLNQEQRAALEQIPDANPTAGMNILGLVMFSVALGICISVMREDGVPLKDFFKSLEGCSMRLISLVIWYSPIGITFLIAAQIVSMENPGAELRRLTGYMITVLLGLFIHGVVVLPALLIVLGRRNPLKYVYGMLQALLTALGTSSSSATLPLSIKCVEENNGIDSRVARFVLPLGATINMDGTALYEAVAALYIAQTTGKPLSLGDVILVSLTATLASIGAAGIPQAGIVTMIMVLIAIGLPPELFILIIPVDFFLDRIRTTVNVHGDSIGCAVVGRLCEGYLLKMDRQQRSISKYLDVNSGGSPEPCKVNWNVAIGVVRPNSMDNMVNTTTTKGSLQTSICIPMNKCR